MFGVCASWVSLLEPACTPTRSSPPFFGFPVVAGLPSVAESPRSAGAVAATTGKPKKGGDCGSSVQASLNENPGRRTRRTPTRARLGVKPLRARSGSTCPTASSRSCFAGDQPVNSEVVKLKPDVEFHNGKTVTADDVIFSIQRIIDPKSAAAATRDESKYETSRSSTTSRCRSR